MISIEKIQWEAMFFNTRGEEPHVKLSCKIFFFEDALTKPFGVKEFDVYSHCSPVDYTLNSSLGSMFEAFAHNAERDFRNAVAVQEQARKDGLDAESIAHSTP